MRISDWSSDVCSSDLAMPQISGAIVGMTLVLTTVFVPLAFMSGSVGVIYRQFSVAMAVSILFSALLALTFTPALCATILKPIPKGHHESKKGFFGWFNRNFERRAEEHTSELQSLMRISYAVFRSNNQKKATELNRKK